MAGDMDLKPEFLVGDEAALRALFPATHDLAAKKCLDRLDRHAREFVARSPFLCIGTQGPDGSADVSPRGDPRGFVKILNDTTLLIPDRPGNNRIDGMLNLLKNPKVALIFMIPTVTETLRVNGSATIHEDTALCDLCAINGRSPKTVLRITVEEVFSHCGKAPLRAGLWKPDTWPDSRPVATLNEIVRDHSNIEVASIEQSAVDELYRKTLY